MARTLWIVDGRKADARTLAANLDLARAIKLERLAEIRAKVIEARSVEADDRALANATRKRWREADREARKLEADLRKVGRASRKAAREMAKPIYVYAQPYGGGHLSDREIKRFDSMFHPKRSFERKPDRLFSFHCKFTSRGFGDRRKDRSRVYRPGEAVKHLRYIIRELAREIANGGLVSNISMDPDELAGFFAALEELESHDRDNANVYMSLVVSLRLQTKKYRAAVPVVGLLKEWIEGTEEWFVCGERNAGTKKEPRWEQHRVMSVKSAWDTARAELKLPHGWGPKLLRHSMATILANRRVPPTDRKLAMGHQALEGSEKAYVIFDPDYLSDVRKVLEDIVSELRGICPAALIPPKPAGSSQPDE